MSDQAEETPLVDLLRSIPEDYRGEWETQWDEDGRATGHAIAPIGLLAHKAVDTIESQERCIKELEQSIDVHDQAESYLSDLIEQKGLDIAELVAMLNKVEDLMTDSVGVEGLHMGGDLATWDSLLTGGFYEDWLGGFSELLDKHTGAE